VWHASNDECATAPAGDHGSCITYTPRYGAWFDIVVHAFDDASPSSGSVVVRDASGRESRFDNLGFGGTSWKTPDYEVG
jgi:hypothetical protein